MTRIVAGAARGRRLQVPSAGTRPTSDRVREAMFSSLEANLRDADLAWAQINVIDAYAGTGALGLEALSRGVAGVVLIERSRPAADLIRRNIQAVALPGARLVVGSVGQVSRQVPSGPPAALILLDPPYDVIAVTIATDLESFATHGWLTPDALCVVERPAADDAVPLPAGWHVIAQRRYGDTVLWYGRRERDTDEENVRA